MYQPMNETIKHRWADALRSGTYRQGQSFLRRRRKVKGDGRPDEFDALGVLCDIIAPDAWVDGARGSIVFDHGEGFGPHGRRSCYPPKFVLSESGLTGEPMRWIARMCDRKYSRISFAEIADWIEGEL